MAAVPVLDRIQGWRGDFMDAVPVFGQIQGWRGCFGAAVPVFGKIQGWRGCFGAAVPVFGVIQGWRSSFRAAIPVFDRIQGWRSGRERVGGHGGLDAVFCVGRRVAVADVQAFGAAGRTAGSAAGRCKHGGAAGRASGSAAGRCRNGGAAGSAAGCCRNGGAGGEDCAEGAVAAKDSGAGGGKGVQRGIGIRRGTAEIEPVGHNANRQAPVQKGLRRSAAGSAATYYHSIKLHLYASFAYTPPPAGYRPREPGPSPSIAPADNRL